MYIIIIIIIIVPLCAADASKTGVTIEAFDYSFGDTSLTTVDVCVEACSIGPGVIIKPRMDMMWTVLLTVRCTALSDFFPNAE